MGTRADGRRRRTLHLAPPPSAAYRPRAIQGGGGRVLADRGARRDGSLRSNHQPSLVRGAAAWLGGGGGGGGGGEEEEEGASGGGEAASALERSGTSLAAARLDAEGAVWEERDLLLRAVLDSLPSSSLAQLAEKVLGRTVESASQLQTHQLRAIGAAEAVRVARLTRRKSSRGGGMLVAADAIAPPADAAAGHASPAAPPPPPRPATRPAT